MKKLTPAQSLQLLDSIKSRYDILYSTLEKDPDYSFRNSALYALSAFNDRIFDTIVSNTELSKDFLDEFFSKFR